MNEASLTNNFRLFSKNSILHYDFEYLRGLLIIRKWLLFKSVYYYEFLDHNNTYEKS